MALPDMTTAYQNWAERSPTAILASRAYQFRALPPSPMTAKGAQKIG
jgi:hypothetical protein